MGLFGNRKKIEEGSIVLDSDYKVAYNAAIRCCPRDGGIKHYAKLDSCMTVAASRVAAGVNANGLLFIDTTILIMFLARAYALMQMKTTSMDRKRLYADSYVSYIKELLKNDNIITGISAETITAMFNDRVTVYDKIYATSGTSNDDLIMLYRAFIDKDITEKVFIPSSKVPIKIGDIFEETSYLSTLKKQIFDTLEFVVQDYEGLDELIGDL